MIVNILLMRVLELVLAAYCRLEILQNTKIINKESDTRLVPS